MATTLAQLVRDLHSIASIDASEKTYALAGRIIGDALRQHNKNYTVATLPDAQAECVLLLAWIKVCLIRAGGAVNDSNTTGANGYGQDRSTPYYKNMDMARQLKERYAELCEDLGLTSSADQITVGKLLVQNDEFNTLAPLLSSENTPDTILSNGGEPNDTTLILRWATSAFDNFKERYVYFIEGDSELYQVWNVSSALGVALINDSATLLYSTTSQVPAALKVTDLDKTKTLRFIVVTRTRFDNYGYSNELVLTP